MITVYKQDGDRVLAKVVKEWAVPAALSEGWSTDKPGEAPPKPEPKPEPDED